MLFSSNNVLFWSNVIERFCSHGFANFFAENDKFSCNECLQQKFDNFLQLYSSSFTAKSELWFFQKSCVSSACYTAMHESGDCFLKSLIYRLKIRGPKIVP